ncbi:hypothetical protein B0H13DRAFT_2462207 [Mycena leptocephala]|nr:hypothetical protein B0H13DRAFT_2462207 [Mycena leptocephala]
MTAEHPPAFEPTVSIELQSVSDSKIIGVSLYSSRAEITRLYKFSVKTGQNQVNISGLPNVLEAESLRVEGRGAATIHDVTVSTAKEEYIPTSSPELTALLNKREKTANALARCQKSIASLEQYLSSLTAEHLDVSKLESVMDNYDSTGEKLDAKKSDLTEQLRKIDADFSFERDRIAVAHKNNKLRVKAAIGVFAQAEGDVEIALIYGSPSLPLILSFDNVVNVLAAVPRATWTAFYDLRVDMSTKEDPINLIYKAITQNTGESWDDVPLTLETSTPTFGLGPQLSPWNLDVDRFDVPNTELNEVRGASVSSKGNFSATFRVPGLVSIPSDGEAHNFTIVQLSLKAEMSWVCVPKADTKAHINARITNASEYTLLSGTASVYVDGSFISRSNPGSEPQRKLRLPSGVRIFFVDPSIRITYHPVIKKLTQSGFYTKSANYVFSQRVTVFNTKGITIDRLKIIDQIPTSQNSQIEVKLVSPALTLPSESAGMSSLKAAPKNATPQVLNVARGVVAQWDGVDEPDLASQAKVNLALEWESLSPASAKIVGLSGQEAGLVSRPRESPVSK